MPIRSHRRQIQKKTGIRPEPPPSGRELAGLAGQGRPHGREEEKKSARSVLRRLFPEKNVHEGGLHRGNNRSFSLLSRCRKARIPKAAAVPAKKGCNKVLSNSLACAIFYKVFNKGRGNTSRFSSQYSFSVSDASFCYPERGNEGTIEPSSFPFLGGRHSYVCFSSWSYESGYGQHHFRHRHC